MAINQIGHLQVVPSYDDLHRLVIINPFHVGEPVEYLGCVVTGFDDRKYGFEFGYALPPRSMSGTDPS